MKSYLFVQNSIQLLVEILVTRTEGITVGYCSICIEEDKTGNAVDTKSIGECLVVEIIKDELLRWRIIIIEFFE